MFCSCGRLAITTVMPYKNGMRTDLNHLPLGKSQELREVMRVLFAEFEDALAGRNAPHRKAGRILKIILFGSYARGDWVADPVGG